MKIKMKLLVTLFTLVCFGLLSGTVQSMTLSSSVPAEGNSNGTTYLDGSFQSWEDDNKTLVTSVGTYKITLGVSLLDKVGTRAGKRETADGSPIKVRLQFLNQKLKKVVIY